MRRYEIEPYDKESPESEYAREEAYLRAKKRLDKLVGFYWHLAVYVVVNIFLIILIGFNSGERFFSFATFSTAFFWGIGLAFHFIGVFGRNFVFGKNWEDRKIKEYMEKDREEFK